MELSTLPASKRLGPRRPFEDNPRLSTGASHGAPAGERNLTKVRCLVPEQIYYGKLRVVRTELVIGRESCLR
jgi:hypothetical protein